MSHNSENPHVFNQFLYANSPNAIVYNQTTLALVSRGVNWFVFIGGLLSCSLSIYLILFRTPEYIQKFSRVLLLCACIDMFDLLTIFGCQTRSKTTDSIRLVSVNGPFKLLSYSNQCMLAAVQSAALPLSSIMLPIQFHYRYSILKNEKLSICYLIFCYTILAVIFAAIGGYIVYQDYCLFDNLERIDYAQLWYSEVPVPQLLVTYKVDSSTTIRNSFEGCITLGAYVAILWFARLTYKQLRMDSSKLSQKTLKIQKQYSRLLFMQALLPLLLVVIPVIISLSELVTNIHIEHSADFAMLSMAFFPMLNSMTTLIFISPYRHECTRILFPCCQNKVDLLLLAHK